MKRPRVRPLADLVAPTLGPALAAQGFSGADIVESWPEIAGERLAAASRPVKVEWPRRIRGADPAARAEPATLVIRVEGAFALELQHLAPLLVERINAVYGWRCIGRLVLKQGPVGRRRPLVRHREPSAAERARVAEAVAAVEPEPLRDALARLGRSVLAADDPSRAEEAGLSLPRSSRHPS